MAIVKIDAKVLGAKKPIEVKQTQGNVKKTLVMQKELIKAGDAPLNDDFEEYITTALEFQVAVEDYLFDVLHLTDAQQVRYEDVDQDEIGDLLARTIMAILGLEVNDNDEEKPAGKE